MAAPLALAALALVHPDVGRLAQENPGKTAFMEYREAQWAGEGRKKSLDWRWVPIARISPMLIKAVLISEDDKFWQHEGFDYEAMQDALEKNLEKGSIRAGGSTISQQLAKNLWLSPERDPVRKLREAVLTWRMERTLSKRRILEIYLNVVEWGDGIFGAEAAARRHFGVAASALSAEQAARLAVCLPNPIRFSPTGDSGFVRKRASIILSRMARRGAVPAEARPEAAEKHPPSNSDETPRVSADGDPVAEALDWVKRNVEEAEKGQ